MRAKLVRIGNSRGIRLPKPLIDEAGLVDDVDVRVQRGAVVITALRRPRDGWASAAADAATVGDNQPVMGPSSTRFEDEWKW